MITIINVLKNTLVIMMFNEYTFSNKKNIDNYPFAIILITIILKKIFN